MPFDVAARERWFQVGDYQSTPRLTADVSPTLGDTRRSRAARAGVARSVDVPLAPDAPVDQPGRQDRGGRFGPVSADPAEQQLGGGPGQFTWGVPDEGQRARHQVGQLDVVA